MHEGLPIALDNGGEEVMLMIIKDSYDVVIAGGGPGGSSAAKNLAELGHSVLLLEKRQEIGAPKRCGEGLTMNTVAIIGEIPQSSFYCRVECRQRNTRTED